MKGDGESCSEFERHTSKIRVNIAGLSVRKGSIKNNLQDMMIRLAKMVDFMQKMMYNLTQ